MTQPAIWKPAAGILLNRLAPLLDKRLESSVRPFDRPQMLRPRADSKLWAWTHYGVFVPELPEPWRYVNTMTFIGTTGTRIFDNEVLATKDPRRNATVLSSTAHDDHHHYRAYDIDGECAFAADGRHLAWGPDLTVDVEYPKFTLKGQYDTFSVDLELEATPQVSWFVDTPVYRHLSLLATYSGHIADASGKTAISGIGTVEYAHCVSPQSLFGGSVPQALKLPADFFTYQILNLSEDTQLLLTDVRAMGVSAARLAHLRSLDGTTEVYDKVTFDVVEWAAEPQVDPAGNTMRTPRRLRWTIGDGVGVIEGVVDSPLRYGHGNGYVGAYHYEGSWRGEPVSGSGYLEWVDNEKV
ncbi:DUF6670 family protein [Antrihabitans sp. YC2-6]|uniref:DUF6670 family protein n=1 Tax=Antrihabitans sp. YC2-6 TaxID=2799498 RepID=UPI0018F32D1B|nr:DUF6670 family protein [Antrihabitans sp. YC2-6]MBJ8347773.1 hypothetical protein [Antrihabitans sp. YC2-6]